MTRQPFARIFLASRRRYSANSSNSGDLMLAKIMMVLVLTFLVLHTPRLVLGLYEVMVFVVVFRSRNTDKGLI